jgi:hypothetical protein
VHYGNAMLTARRSLNRRPLSAGGGRAVQSPGYISYCGLSPFPSLHTSGVARNFFRGGGGGGFYLKFNAGFFFMDAQFV